MTPSEATVPAVSPDLTAPAPSSKPSVEPNDEGFGRALAAATPSGAEPRSRATGVRDHEERHDPEHETDSPGPQTERSQQSSASSDPFSMLLLGGATAVAEASGETEVTQTSARSPEANAPQAGEDTSVRQTPINPRADDVGSRSSGIAEVASDENARLNPVRASNVGDTDASDPYDPEPLAALQPAAAGAGPWHPSIPDTVSSGDPQSGVSASLTPVSSGDPESGVRIPPSTFSSGDPQSGVRIPPSTVSSGDQRSGVHASQAPEPGSGAGDQPVAVWSAANSASRSAAAGSDGLGQGTKAFAATSTSSRPGTISTTVDGTQLPSVGAGAGAYTPTSAGTSSTSSPSGGTPEPAAASPAQQLVNVLAPLRTSANGAHEITLALQPEGLGTVRATMTVGPQEIRVQLTTDSAPAHQALREALAQLHQELGSGGARTTIWLNDGGGGKGRDTGAESSYQPPQSLEEEALEVKSSSDGDVDRLVDLRL